MRKYEAVYIMDSALPEEEQSALMERLQRVVGDQGGSVDGVDKWERRRLAYEIKGKREGIYVVMTFSGRPAVSAELDRVMRLADNVLRHLVVAIEEKQVKSPTTETPTEPAAIPTPEPAAAPTPEPAETPEAEPAAPPEAEPAAAPEAEVVNAS